MIDRSVDTWRPTNSRRSEACSYACDVQLVVVLLAAALLLVVLSFVISALKWLLIIAAVLVAVGLVAGWRPGRRSTYH